MNNMQLWLISSTDSINLNSAADGYYLNPDLDGLTGLPSIRSSNGVNAGYDGGWTSTQLWDARLITIRGLIVDKDGSQVELKRKALSKLVGQGKKEPLTLKFVTEFGRTYTCTVRTTNCTMALQNIFTRQEYQIQLRADDPLIYDDGGNDVKATLRVTEDNTGFEIPFDIPLDISGGADPVVVDAGEDTNYPLITMYGELHSPTIVNQTTNQQLQLGADLNGLIRDWNETDTASGNSLQITNSTEYDAPILDFKMNGETSQTTYTGKNLFNKGNDLTQMTTNANNATITKTASTITIQTTASTSAGFYILNNAFTSYIDGFNNTKTYTISADITTSANTQIRFGFESGMTQVAVNGKQRVSNTSTSASIGSAFVCYAFVNGITVKVENIQIEESATMTSYEPYVGSKASPNPDFPQWVNTTTGENVVKVNGQNLIELKPYYYGYFYGNAVGTAINYDITTNADKVSYNVNADGTSSVVATASWRGVILMSDPLTTGTYYFNVDGVSTTANQGASVYVLDGNHIITRQVVNLTGNPITDQLKMSITLTGDERYIALGVGCRTTAGTVNLGTFMISVGSSPVPYEKYRGENYEVNLGKNLVWGTNIGSAMNGLTSDWNATTGYVHITGQATSTWANISDNIYPSEHIKAGTYVFSSTPVSSNIRKMLRLYYLDGTFNTFTIPKDATSISFTITKEVNRFYFYIDGYSNGDDIDETFAVQLEVGSTATSWSKYFTPIELCKIGTYQDYIWNDGGTWKIHKATGRVVLDGTESWGGTPLATGIRYYFIANSLGLLSGNSTGSDIMSDLFKGISYSAYFSTGGVDGVTHNTYSSNTYLQLFFITAFESFDALRTWLSTNKPVIYYALATPTDTAITESALITQLNAIVQASLPVGLNNVSNISITPNLAGEMVLTYGTGYIETPPDLAVIDCKDRTVSINGVNAFNLLADGSEFIRLEPGENKLYLTSETQSDSGYAEVKFKTGNLSI